MDSTGPAPLDSGTRSPLPRVAVALIGLAVAWIVVANAVPITCLLLAPCPRGPWEAGEVVDGWRFLHGLPVYEDPKVGHSTLLYGAMMPVTLGTVFRYTGPNMQAARGVVLASALLLSLGVAGVLTRRQPFWVFVVAWAMLFGINERAAQYFVETRPDMSAHLFSAIGVILMAHGYLRRRHVVYALGIAAVVLGFFYKQTAAVCMGISAVAILADLRRPLRQRIVWALLPGAVMVAVVAALRIKAPLVYHYMIWLPAQFHVDRRSIPNVSMDLLRAWPLFLAALFEWLVCGDGWRGGARPATGECADGGIAEDRRAHWALAAVLVQVPACALAGAKWGADANTYVPAWLAMGAFVALRLPRVDATLRCPALPVAARNGLAAGLALLMVLSIFPQVVFGARFLRNPLPGSREYRAAVARAAGLPGKVISPEDPTIALLAKGYAGRSVFLEYDNNPVKGEWSQTTVEPMRNEIRDADYVVVVRVWRAIDPLHEEELTELGFAPMDPSTDGPGGTGAYAVWRNARKGGSGSSGGK